MENKKADLLRQLADKNDELAALVASRDEAIRLDKKERDDAILSFLKLSGIFLLIIFIPSIIFSYSCDNFTFRPLHGLLVSLLCGYCMTIGLHRGGYHQHEEKLDKQIVQAHTDIANLTRWLERLDRTDK